MGKIVRKRKKSVALLVATAIRLVYICWLLHSYFLLAKDGK